MKIYVINHTTLNQPYPKIYTPLLVGAANKESTLKNKAFRDNTGDNISTFNDSYCELTGLYWIWKNSNDTVVGLVHYRRFFLGIKHRISFHDDLFVKDYSDLKYCHLLTPSEISKLLDKHDIIVKVSHRYHFNMQDKLLQYINEECLHNLLHVLHEQNQKEFHSFEKYLKRHSQVLFNMFIGKKNIIDQYCEWLFPILEKIDQKHIEDEGERYQNRELGYLGEILFSFWLDYNCISYFPADTLMPRQSDIQKIAGIDMPDGSNVYPISRFPSSVCKLIYRIFKKIERELQTSFK